MARAWRLQVDEKEDELHRRMESVLSLLDPALLHPAPHHQELGAAKESERAYTETSLLALQGGAAKASQNWDQKSAGQAAPSPSAGQAASSPSTQAAVVKTPRSRAGYVAHNAAKSSPESQQLDEEEADEGGQGKHASIAPGEEHNLAQEKTQGMVDAPLKEQTQGMLDAPLRLESRAARQDMRLESAASNPDRHSPSSLLCISQQVVSPVSDACGRACCNATHVRALRQSRARTQES
jgi:hypothetical protein